MNEAFGAAARTAPGFPRFSGLPRYYSPGSALPSAEHRDSAIPAITRATTAQLGNTSSCRETAGKVLLTSAKVNRESAQKWHTPPWYLNSITTSRRGPTDERPHTRETEAP